MALSEDVRQHSHMSLSGARRTLDQRPGASAPIKRKSEPMQLNFQNHDGHVPPYQARQLIRMIEKYGLDP